MTRDQIAQQLMLQQQQQRQMPGRPLGSPFAPAPVPQQAPLVAGNPTPPVAAPQYGFQTGYNAAIGPRDDRGGGDTWAKKLKEMLFGVSGTQGGAAP